MSSAQTAQPEQSLENASVIQFAPNQRYKIGSGSVPLPDPANASSVRPLAGKALDRATYSLEKTAEAIAGERPLLGGESKGGKWLSAMFAMMSRLGYNMQDPHAYFTTKTHQIVLGYRPTSHFLVQERKDLEDEIKGVTGVRVLGTGRALQSQGQLQRIQDDARISVALPGDMNTLEEMLELIERKMKGEMVNQPLIIENSAQGGDEYFWDEIFRSLKILQTDHDPSLDPRERRRYVDLEALAQHFGIYVTEDRLDTLGLVRELDKAIPKQDNDVNEQQVIKDGSIIFVATGTRKKHDELAAMFKEQGVNVQIRPVFELVDTYVSPKETSATYEGNVAEKIKAAHEAWQTMDEQTRVKRLEHLGIRKNQAFFLAEDSGFHFLEPNIVMEDEFGKIRHHLDPNAPFPGVETGPGTIGVNGIAHFMQSIGRVFARRPNANRGVVQKSILAIAPLDQPTLKKDRMFMIGASNTGTFTTTPAPQSDTIQIDHYLIPPDVHGLRAGLTEAQLGERYTNHFSPRALAWKAMVRELGIPTNIDHTLDHGYSKEFVAGVVTDEFNTAAKDQIAALQKKDFKDGFSVKELSPDVKEAIDPQTGIFEKADGIVLAFDPKTAEEDILRNLYILTSAIVGEQTHDKMKLGKPLYLVNPDGAFDDLIKLVYDFHYLGTVPQDPETLLKQASSVEDAVEKLQEDRKSYRRYHLPSYVTQDEPFEIIGRPSRKAFNVGVLLSATTENATHLEDTEKLVKGLIRQDIGIITGGGEYGPMGVATQIAYDMRSSHSAFHGASNVPHIMSGEGDVSEKVSEFFKARNIYERMEYIANADSFTVLPGGTGTVQEMVLFAMLKKHGHEIMADKDIVVVNRTINHRGQERPFYDVLEEIIPKKDQEELGIHFVDSVDQALAKTLALRAQKLNGADLDHLTKERD